ncbi:MULTISPECIES: MFS transporter [Tatumella]|uniref:MFS transporter n=1 Tax=Tatumella punctata TaxID=399969 RepID=A0ABW1VN15_9GAMM|nr:MFS transporter [Tatumella sp. JGM130]MBS0892984.1 MFS transporter [Tatumella sp. JGM130]
MSEQTFSRQNERIRPPVGLFPAMLALGAGGLSIGTGEFAPMSLLPDLARGTGVTVPVAGGYISAYAAGVVIGAPAITVLGARHNRKTLLLVLLVIAFAGYALTALAAGHNAMLTARFIAGMPHGAWYGVSALVAASMVSPQYKARYIGYVMLGLAIANVAGVPLVTRAGQALGWRMSFWIVAWGLVLTALMVVLFIPSVAADKSASPLKELGALKKPQILMTFAVASVSFAGMFAVYSFITPALTDTAGFPLGAVPWILALWGAGMVAGNIIGGRLADIALVPSIFGIILWNIVFLGLFSLAGTLKAPALIVLFMLGCGFSLVPALQSHMMNIAGEAQTLASSLTHSAFNISNALGAAAGGFIIVSGGSWISTGWVGACFSILALFIMFLSVRIKDRSHT